jgi:hypothetical protein
MGLFTGFTGFTRFTRFTRFTIMRRFAVETRHATSLQCRGRDGLEVTSPRNDDKAGDMRRLEKKSKDFFIREIRNNIRNEKFVRFVSFVDKKRKVDKKDN